MKPDEVLALVTGARSRRKSEKKFKANFEVGDYVLVGTTQFETQAKTAPRWIGPFKDTTSSELILLPFIVAGDSKNMCM